MKTRKKTKKKAKTVIPNHARVRQLRRFSVFICIVALILIAALPLAAGEKKPADYALIFGTVWDANDHAVPGAKVKIRRADQKKAKWMLVSDSRGEFAQRVPVGTADYVVSAEAPGKKRAAAETTVHIEHNERADIGLHLAP
jgi:hypothetical protein